MTELLPGEHVRCLARPHVIVLIQSLWWTPLVAGAAALLSVVLRLVPVRGVGVLVAPAVLLALLIVATGAGAAYTSWSSRFVLVTDLRAIQQSGIVRRRRTMIPLDRIQDVTTRRGFVGTLLDYGDIIVTTAGLPVSASPAEKKIRGEGMVARPSLVLARVRSPERVARSLFQTPISGMLDDHDGFPKAAGAARFHGRRQVDGGSSGGGAGRRHLRRPRSTHRA
jgi:membrane protein YdbS with pleckstrin-like domain